MSKDLEQTLTVGALTAAGFGTLVMTLAIMQFSLTGALAATFLYGVGYGCWRMTGKPLFPNK